MSNKSGLKVDIIYEDNDCIAVYKPAGLMVHSDGRAKGPFLTDWIIEHFPQTTGVGDPMTSIDGKPVDRSGIVHRLDRETSGVLLIAKTAAGHADLKRQFKDRTITKKYLTFVWGDVKEEFGTINRPIGRSGSDFRKYSAQRGARGDMREAETYWTRIGKGVWNVPISILPVDKDMTNKKVEKVDDFKEEKFSYLEVEPKTGRTHQIRVHFNAVNNPVVGDSLYAPKRPMVLGFERLALHSKSIEFKNLEGKTIKVEAPLPVDFINACKELGIKSK